MLLEFSVANFRSIGEEQTLYMQPARKSKADDDHNILQTGIKREPEALPCVAILGANASGKSNVLKAMFFLQNIVEESSLRKKDDVFGDNRFRLNPAYTKKPTYFRTKFVAKDGHMYQYWLELVPEAIIHEKLTVIPNTKGAREVTLIDRQQNKIELHRSIHPKKSFLDVWKAEINNQQTALAYLANKGEISIFEPITRWFATFAIASPTDYPEFITTSAIKSGTITQQEVINILQAADIHIHGINIMEEESSQDLSPYEKKIHDISDGRLLPRLKTIFTHLDTQGNLISFDLKNDESNGTKSLFALSVIIISTLIIGSRLIIDELNSTLHPYLVRKIIQLYTNKETNPHGAQLIFATHDVTVMDKTLLRPDEIYFTEKDRETFETKLFSLSEFKGVGSVGKNDRGQKLYKDYLDGRFGAVPEVDWDGGL
ncbi:MAG: hypothetical protein BA863_10900 [Desulfovibrio sp. S3730MH75]|nr:MAG: hypothetical protein BA863_10900 [Desulfovibrio sp. S3730MH75]